MKTIVGGFIIAVILLAAGAVLWAEAGTTSTFADAQERLTTLRYPTMDAIDSTNDRWPVRRWQLGTLGEDINRYRTGLTYWLGRNKALTPLLEATGAGAVKDANVMFVAANALFRTSDPEGPDRKAAVERLDGVMQAYADVLRLDPTHEDAAFNYEYVARLRDMIAKNRKPLRAIVNPTDTIQDDLPPGPTVHGWPGAPPPSVDLGEFKTLTPMKFEEREEQQADPGQGTFQRRKG